jgi:8-oxo-dGTP diphosphatase
MTVGYSSRDRRVAKMPARNTVTVAHRAAPAGSPPAQISLAIDLVILTIRADRLNVLLIERGNEPYRNRRALPGGFVRAAEDLDEAAVRELREETGIQGETLHLEQVRTYASPGRDPRGRVASVAYLAIAPDLPTPTAGTDAASAHWVPVDHADRLAFDHDVILGDAIERARSKLEYSPLAAAFCHEPFTIGELRAVYEAVWGCTLDPRNFHRKVTGVDGFVIPTGDRRSPPVGRPASLYRRGDAAILHPAMLRPAKPRD